MKTPDFWEALFYGSLGVFLLWAILKSIGIIGSPIWLEIGVPVLSAGIALGSFYQRFKQVEKDVTKVETDINKVKGDVDTMKYNIKAILESLANISKRLEKAKS